MKFRMTQTSTHCHHFHDLLGLLNLGMYHMHQNGTTTKAVTGRVIDRARALSGRGLSSYTITEPLNGGTDARRVNSVS